MDSACVQFVSGLPSDRMNRDKTTSFVVKVNREAVMLTCDECSQWYAFSCTQFAADQNRIFSTAKNGADFFRIVSLTDCANAYSAILAVQPKSMCKLDLMGSEYVYELGSRRKKDMI